MKKVSLKKPIGINIKRISHKFQRYPTVGDWEITEGIEETYLDISISSMNNWKYESLVALHELVEVLLCKDRKITQARVDKFDKDFENKRKKGNTDEPGDDPRAPYFKEHKFATKIEKLLAKELKVDWKRYEKLVNNL